MNCKEAEKMVSLFLEDSLDNRELEEFMEHIEACDECKEELSIQFLVSEGMNRLEGGNVFDLRRELDDKLNVARQRLLVRQGMQQILYLLEGLTAAALIIVAFLIHFRWFA